mgnify:CR=1 FL=1
MSKSEIQYDEHRLKACEDRCSDLGCENNDLQWKLKMMEKKYTVLEKERNKLKDLIAGQDLAIKLMLSALGEAKKQVESEKNKNEGMVALVDMVCADLKDCARNLGIEPSGGIITTTAALHRELGRDVSIVTSTNTYKVVCRHTDGFCTLISANYKYLLFPTEDVDSVVNPNGELRVVQKRIGNYITHYSLKPLEK